jgi:hypothetical protein
MTRLVFTGIRNHRRVRVVWADGALSGDLEACAWIRQVAAQHGVGVFKGEERGAESARREA